MDRLDALKVFCTVVETGSFRSGADRLGVSTSSVTNQIAALEARFGVRLLNRTTRRMSLTDEGRHCYQMAQRILGDVGTLEDDLSGAHLEPRGLLRVDMPGLVSRLFVAPVLPSFLDRYPDITIRATVSDRLVDMVEEGIDVMVRIGSLPDSGLVARHLMPTKYICCASPAYLQRFGVPTRPEDLVDHRCLNFVLPKTRQIRSWQFIRPDQPDEAALQHSPAGRIAMDHVDSLIAMCEAGAGIAQFMSLSVSEQLRDGRLIAILTDWQAPGPSVSALYQHRHHRVARVQVFLDFLVDIFKEKISARD
ncbi:MAG: LysR family transcriptional regulator [Herbaspirillum sp.]|nr:LysR family transcriptional regulator [Herbaspirillum sp.]